MRFVDRSKVKVPNVLSGPEFERIRQDYLQYLQLAPETRKQTRPPGRDFKHNAQLNSDVGELFGWCCAFCEQETRTEAFRFRPTGNASPADVNEFGFLAYGWLADAWENLYPICDDCRPANLRYFPVSAKRIEPPTADTYANYAIRNNGRWILPIDETPVLLDPCGDQKISTHLKLLSNGVLDGKTERGRETIKNYNLNRKNLVEDRRNLLNEKIKDLRIKMISNGGSPSYHIKKGSIPLLEFKGLATDFLLNLNEESPELRPEWNSERAAIEPEDSRSENEFAPKMDDRFSRLDIGRYKSLARVSINIPLPPPATDYPRSEARAAALLILGENANGKSSILEAIALAMITPEAREELEIDPSSLILNPRFMGLDDQRAATAKVSSSAVIALSFTDKDGKKANPRVLQVKNGQFTDRRNYSSQLPVFAYGAYRNFLDADHQWTPARGVISLFRSDMLLSKPEAWLIGLPDNQFSAVVRALRFIFNVGDQFEIIERDPASAKCMVITAPTDGARIRTPLSSVSSGFRAILALSCDVMRWLMAPGMPWHFENLSDAKGIILIDEVEAHLHPRWKIRIMDGLRQALPGMTFIATTHDPLCLRGMNDGEVLVLNRVPGAAAGSDLPIFVETVTKLPNVSKLTIEQLLTSDLFNLFDTDDSKAAYAMAELADALVWSGTKEPEGKENHQKTIDKFKLEIDRSLPVGSTEVARLVQEAVAEYVKTRGKVTGSRRMELRNETKATILKLLEGQDAPR